MEEGESQSMLEVRKLDSLVVNLNLFSLLWQRQTPRKFNTKIIGLLREKNFETYLLLDRIVNVRSDLLHVEGLTWKYTFDFRFFWATDIRFWNNLKTFLVRKETAINKWINDFLASQQISYRFQHPISSSRRSRLEPRVCLQEIRN